MKIAMWSGPRNLSTAMMYSFAARGDCAVVDEPFYAAYLAKTGLDHPMGQEILASQSRDPFEVQSDLRADDDAPVSYQKHMCQHMIDGMPRDFMQDAVNVFLIRHPARVIASYAAKRERPTLADIGFQEQLDLFHHTRALGQTPVVVDSADIRADPDVMLCALCDAIGLPYTDAMLSWPEGGHPADGVWAKHWYGAVWKSTGFAAAEGPLPDVPGEFRPVLDEALPIYEEMQGHRLCGI